MAENAKPNIMQAIERMPKAELHVHLEGSVSQEMVEELAQKHEVDLGPSKGAVGPSASGYGHLINFLDSYRLRCKCLCDVEDFELICVDVLENLRAQNVRYAEIMISPTAHRLHGLSIDYIMPGIEAGAAKVCGNGIEARFILDIGRQFGTEHAWQTAREVVRHRDGGMIAIGLGGDEIHYAPEIFAEQFEFIRKQGIHRIAHAGEVAGSASVWGALKTLHVERIGHGIGARGDEELLEYLRVQQVPLEMCPTSNVKTGALRSYSDNPLPEFLRRGIMVTLNSDDPAMFEITLTDEYKLCVEEFGLDWDEIKTLCLNGVRASFLPDMDKQELLEEFEKELAEIESDLNLN